MNCIFIKFVNIVFSILFIIILFFILSISVLEKFLFLYVLKDLFNVLKNIWFEVNFEVI